MERPDFIIGSDWPDEVSNLPSRYDGPMPTSRSKSTTSIGTFRIQPAGVASGALRVAVTRRPPRGVAKARWVREGYFDVWWPNLAPSRELLTRFHPSDLADSTKRTKFFRAYRRELARPEAQHEIDLLAAVASRTPVTIGCFCENEQHCHRSVLKEFVDRAMTQRGRA